MIDIENDVFDNVAKALRATYEGIFVSGEYTGAPSKFPAVTLTESSNAVYERMRTSATENAVRVMYEANVYSNKAMGKKAEAKAVMSTLDGVMSGMGFTRTFYNQVPNLQDSTIFRLVSRYEAIVGPGDEGKYLIYQN